MGRELAVCWKGTRGWTASIRARPQRSQLSALGAWVRSQQNANHALPFLKKGGAQFPGRQLLSCEFLVETISPPSFLTVATYIKVSTTSPLQQYHAARSWLQLILRVLFPEESLPAKNRLVPRPDGYGMRHFLLPLEARKGPQFFKFKACWKACRVTAYMFCLRGS